LTYFTELDAPGAVIVIRCPVARVSVIFGNIGLASTISARPGASGYMPSAAKTYHADVAPRSSLPGRPSSVGLNSSSAERRTMSCVFDGAPA
jgi:hypothetical protein